MRHFARSAAILSILWFAGCRETVGPGEHRVIVIAHPPDTVGRTGAPPPPIEPRQRPADTTVVIIIKRP